MRIFLLKTKKKYTISEKYILIEDYYFFTKSYVAEI